jgi:succinate dehydrogenase/fumarate reductase flavoprotein subunit
VSVHGANRLGTNSLLDLLVFGRAAGNHIVEFNPKQEHKPLPARTPPTARWNAWPLDNNHQRRIRARRGQRHARLHAAARWRVPHPGQHG